MRARYEEGLVATALLRHHLRLEADPEGQQIEAIVIDAGNVILPGDFPLASKIPWTLLNYVHVRTRDRVIRQELLFAVGERYRSDLVEESGRNLRGLGILSVARLVAARGSTPDKVIVLVVTKDQWSLRLNTSFQFDQARLDYLGFSFAEENLAGRNKRITLDFSFDPGRFRIGTSYTDPRIFGSRHQLQAVTALYLDRQTSRPEGSTLDVIAGRPLFSLRTEWAWQGEFYFLRDKVRFFTGDRLRDFAYKSGPVQVPRGGVLWPLYGTIPTQGQLPIPEIYGRHMLYGNLQGTRSFGVEHKVNITAGFTANSSEYVLTEEFPAGLVPDSVRDAFLKTFVPTSERTVGPFVSLHAYAAHYARLKNINTLALSEDFKLGPDLQLQLTYASPTLGSNTNFVALSGSYSHVVLWHDDLLTFQGSVATRLQNGMFPGSMLVNEDVSGGLRNVSPPIGPFRLHLRGYFRFRGHDITHVPLTLGLDNGLRGFDARSIPFSSLPGNNLYIVNAELRTLALNLWTLHLGGVLFYDGGDAPPSLSAATWHQDVGLGLRILIPQFNHDVVSLDLAFPLEGPASGAYAPRFSAEFGQAF